MSVFHPQPSSGRQVQCPAGVASLQVHGSAWFGVRQLSPIRLRSFHSFHLWPPPGACRFLFPFNVRRTGRFGWNIVTRAMPARSQKPKSVPSKSLKDVGLSSWDELIMLCYFFSPLINLFPLPCGVLRAALRASGCKNETNPLANVESTCLQPQDPSSQL